jgi:hypothetical protein
MVRVIKFVINTKDLGFKFEPKIENEMNWNFKIFYDSDWRGNPETRISVTGFLV